MSGPVTSTQQLCVVADGDVIKLVRADDEQVLVELAPRELRNLVGRCLYAAGQVEDNLRRRRRGGEPTLTGRPVSPAAG